MKRLEFLIICFLEKGKKVLCFKIYSHCETEFLVQMKHVHSRNISESLVNGITRKGHKR